MNGGTIFIIIILVIVGVLAFIYQSKYEKLKRFTTILLIAFFSWAISRETPNGINGGIIIFTVVTVFVIYIWKKMDAEELEKKEVTTTSQFKSFLKSIKDYNKYLEENNVIANEELRSTTNLPFDKNRLIVDTLIYIKYLSTEEQKSLFYTIPQLAFYKDNIAEEGLISNASKGLSKTDDDFPYELYEKCKNESNKIFNQIKDLIGDKNYDYRK